ncbi:MAG: DUF1570 domain-containing protein, partial [Kiritimatiellae bacterium]|nr:DUF1570 domain-containing protein [Kiritimatiellia bacterium]
LTNSLPALRREYARVAPSPGSITNSLASVRVFATQSEYLEYVGNEYEWTAGLYSPLHRELVAWLPPQDESSLMRTLQHEAFHQYLAVAGELATAAPWFNEGNAEMFERATLSSSGKVEISFDPEAMAFIRARADELAGLIPALLQMDYQEFYSGTPEAVELKYRLAWSICYFLEIGAPSLKGKPFASLRSDYMRHLVETRDMLLATERTLPPDLLAKFIASWRKFYISE